MVQVMFLAEAMHKIHFRASDSFMHADIHLHLHYICNVLAVVSVVAMAVVMFLAVVMELAMAVVMFLAVVMVLAIR